MDSISHSSTTATQLCCRLKHHRSMRPSCASATRRSRIVPSAQWRWLATGRMCRGAVPTGGRSSGTCELSQAFPATTPQDGSMVLTACLLLQLSAVCSKEAKNGRRVSQTLWRDWRRRCTAVQAARCGLDTQQSLHAVGMHHVHNSLPRSCRRSTQTSPRWSRGSNRLPGPL